MGCGTHVIGPHLSACGGKKGGRGGEESRKGMSGHFREEGGGKERREGGKGGEKKGR